jgi:hypothetical protein
MYVILAVCNLDNENCDRLVSLPFRDCALTVLSYCGVTVPYSRLYPCGTFLGQTVTEIFCKEIQGHTNV